ncbi:hypothetical protein JAAARDRAFT_328254 [Jaapia argillacea MUCL 33604]|uniref:Uncharacterized protein n=1 Tax=Jaapia argillacea MUCL 33604 TaxID=933084 RepID=A0A067PWR7_9AGAM|nr:hypothetical protein JAAARDRAFT_328254 [Jaapia argillacea MUCL 33604]
MRADPRNPILLAHHELFGPDPTSEVLLAQSDCLRWISASELSSYGDSYSAVTVNTQCDQKDFIGCLPDRFSMEMKVFSVSNTFSIPDTLLSLGRRDKLHILACRVHVEVYWYHQQTNRLTHAITAGESVAPDWLERSHCNECDGACWGGDE